MYNEDSDCGVLGDFDLSIDRRSPRLPGTDRTGFMAITLLSDKYLHGKMERKYRHELEALIWVLLLAVLRFIFRCLHFDKIR